MRIVHINVVPNLSTGRIAAEICRLTIQSGHQALLCYSRNKPPRDVPSLKIGNMVGTLAHLGFSRLTDHTGFFSRYATQKLIKQLKRYNPDIVHLHNLHGYYLHLPTLFRYLKENDIPVVWTLHDCWSYTGHCAYYSTAKADRHLSFESLKECRDIACRRWQRGCDRCMQKHQYPASWLMDRSRKNWLEKRALFTGIPHMVLTTPSQWLRNEVKQSFLKDYAVYVFPNGLDMERFAPCTNEDYLSVVEHSYGLDKLRETNKELKLILSVAAVWDERKGLDDLLVLGDELGEEYCILTIGLDENQIQALPQGNVIGFPRTESPAELCALYTVADLYVSASSEETMGMTLIEALACGTQVLCYDSTAMPEIVTPEVGEVVPLWDIPAMAQAVRRLCDAPKDPEACRCRAMDYEAGARYSAYIQLYENMYPATPSYRRATAETPEENMAAEETEAEVPAESGPEQRA